MGRLPDVFGISPGPIVSSPDGFGDGAGPPPAAVASVADGTPRERVRWGRVVLVALSGVVSHVFGRATVGVLVPAMADDLELSDTLIGALGSANMGAYFTGVIIVTFTAGRIEPFTLLRAGIVTSTLGLAVIGTASSPAAIVIGTALAGLGGGGIWLTAPVIASEGVPASRRGAALGTLTATMGAALIGVPIATTALRNAAGDDALWRPVWLAQAALSIVLLLALSLLVRARRTERVAAVGGLGALRQIHGWKRAVAAYVGFAYMASSFANFLGRTLESDHDFSRTAATLAFSVMGAGSIVGALTFGRLSDRIGRPATMATVMALSAVAGATLAAQIPSGAIVVVAVVIFGGASFSFPSLTATFVSDHVSDRTFAAVLGTMTMFYGPASVIGPAASGWLADRTGDFSATYWAIAAIALTSGVCMATMRRRDGVTPQAAPVS
ncbi:MAG: YbfB/YjiJ family MFS transporter [Acidimicrobiales bacterium]|nr:YbfB/YjiJ family MFS transporter [Acidimicrobiales bacterium]MYG87117.1 YbfB/YjiJ family MFS transporter [Acidimicrobiales bacterium]MYI27079.1 YbfB/YjiJ family MFS transporter [Acidimicrobiales bacterium]